VLSAEPSRDCPLCPRLHDFIAAWRLREPTWFNAPVPTFLPPEGDPSVRFLIVGLAPGLRGANRTGRPFTGDYAGDLLYSTLIRFGFARGQFLARPDDGLELVGTAITNAVRCVPPENKPVGAEIATCRTFLVPTLQRFPNLEAVLTLGAIAHQSTVRALGGRVAAFPFKHGTAAPIGGLTLFSSYHCSRYNTNTGVLTEAMFVQVFEAVRRHLDGTMRPIEADPRACP
jgi:uracil-DNA glycosylase family 4